MLVTGCALRATRVAPPGRGASWASAYYGMADVAARKATCSAFAPAGLAARQPGGRTRRDHGLEAALPPSPAREQQVLELAADGPPSTARASPRELRASAPATVADALRPHLPESSTSPDRAAAGFAGKAMRLRPESAERACVRARTLKRRAGNQTRRRRFGALLPAARPVFANLRPPVRAAYNPPASAAR